MLGKYNRLFVSIGLGLSVVASIHYWYRNKRPLKWKQVGYLGEIFFYPMKSCGALSVNEGECEILGLKVGNFRDRIFMVIDSNKNYISGRMNSDLIKIKPKFGNKTNQIVLQADGFNDHVVDVDKIDKTNTVHCKIWNDNITVVDCGEDTEKWISKAILNQDSGLKLVYYPKETSDRSVRKKFMFSSNMSAADCGAFADGSSFMLASDNTLKDLNTKLDKPVNIVQFRPNFVVMDSEPFDEDNWKMIKIGEQTIFKVVLPCNRCHFVNVNPVSGEPNKKNEPLETLKSYRQISDSKLRKIIGNSPKMGMQLGLENAGSVQIGDPVYVTY